MLINRKQTNIISKFWLQTDKVILLCVCVLLFIGFILIISASPFVAIRIGKSATYFIHNHVINMCLGMITIVIISILNEKYIFKYSIWLMLFFLALMVMVVLLGSEVKGAKRWFYMAGLSLQPSEFAKAFYPIVVVSILSFFNNQLKHKILKYICLISFHGFFVILLLLEPDVGSTFLISIVFLCLLIADKIGFIWIIFSAFLGTLFTVSSYFIFPHVNYRINEFFMQQRTYQAEKAIEAIERGKLLGAGVGQGKIKEYIPDVHTDFIFTIAAEEFGVVLNIIIIILYLIIIFRSIHLSIRQNNIKNLLANLVCCLLLAFQSFIHIASNISLIPTKGMTLPLISYGGSSMLSTCILIGFILCFTKCNIQNVILKVK